VRRGSGVGGRGTCGVAEVRSKSKSASSAVSGVAIVNGGEARNRVAFGSILQLTCVCWNSFWRANGQSKARSLRMLDELVLRLSHSNFKTS
jgi:hypothetical protein